MTYRDSPHRDLAWIWREAHLFLQAKQPPLHVQSVHRRTVLLVHRSHASQRQILGRGCRRLPDNVRSYPPAFRSHSSCHESECRMMGSHNAQWAPTSSPTTKPIRQQPEHPGSQATQLTAFSSRSSGFSQDVAPRSCCYTHTPSVRASLQRCLRSNPLILTLILKS